MGFSATQDIERRTRFYEAYFGAAVGAAYVNAKKGFESRFLSFQAGARIEVMKSNMLTPVILEPGAQRLGLTHLALAVGSERQVDELTQRLKIDGYAVLDGPRRMGDGEGKTRNG